MGATRNGDGRFGVIGADDDNDFGGLQRDLSKIIPRRQALQWVGGLSLAGLLTACTSDDGGSSGEGPASTPPANSTTGGAESTGTSATAGQATGSTDEPDADGPAEATAGPEIPDETAGPFPADGSNGPNLLDGDGVVRSNLTTSIGSLSGTAEGVATTFELTIVDATTGDPRPGAAVYLWHCTADGRYSIYEMEDQNYLRGLQTADDAGRVTFTSVFPGCYPGRWPHCHFEVYDGDATASAQAIKTSQLALPQVDCETIYADSRYGDSADHLSTLSLSTDGVFQDGWEDQLATVSVGGDAVTASLLVRV